MKIVSHRRNTISELAATDTKFGVEIDVRSEGGQLILQHEPFNKGVYLEDWLHAYQHSFLILNVKEEGLESRLISLMKSHRIEEYFFLDQSFPFLVKYSNLGEHRCAVRISEYESIETALTLSGKIDWVWVDYFTHFPLTQQHSCQINEAGFKVCLVSPELQGFDPLIEIPKLIALLQQRHIKVDAVCTKRPDIWDSLSNLL